MSGPVESHADPRYRPLTLAVRAADEAFEKAGDAGTKTWLDDYFLPALTKQGLTVEPTEREARTPLEARVAALEAALSTAGDFIVGLGLPCGTRLVWEDEYHALLSLIDGLVEKPHGWLAALADAGTEEVGRG